MAGGVNAVAQRVEERNGLCGALHDNGKDAHLTARHADEFGEGLAMPVLAEPIGPREQEM
jgi:hypothetical protein